MIINKVILKLNNVYDSNAKKSITGEFHWQILLPIYSIVTFIVAFNDTKLNIYVCIG